MICIGAQVEPKVFLANERTLIHWFNVATTLAGLGSTLLALDSKRNSEVLTPVALLTLFVAAMVVCFGLNVFHARAKKIGERSATRWDDPHGPFVVGIGIAVAFIAAFFVMVTNFGADGFRRV